MPKVKISAAYAVTPDNEFVQRGEVVDVPADTAKRWREIGAAVGEKDELQELGYPKVGETRVQAGAVPVATPEDPAD